MNEQDTTLLNNYFNGLLSENETAQTLKRVESEPEFAAEFYLREEMEGFVGKEQRRNELKNTIQNLGKSYFTESDHLGTAPVMKARITRSRWLTTLAAALCLALAALWFLNQEDTNLYQQFGQHPPLSLTLRGNAENSASLAEKAFNAKDYTAALAALQDVLKEHPDSVNAQLFQGICLIELKRPQEARALLMPLTLQNNALKNDALWNIALSYVSEKNNEAAISYLKQIPNDDNHYTKAVDLLSKLK